MIVRTLRFVVTARSTPAMSETSRTSASPRSCASQSETPGTLMNGSCVQRRRLRRAAAGQAAERADREVGAGTGAEQVDGHTGDDVVDAEDHRGQGVDRATDDAHEDRAEDARPRGRSGSRRTRHPTCPRIIMPSRPMLTTPARSIQRPPRPARPIGHRQPDRGREGARGVDVLGAGDDADRREDDEAAARRSATQNQPARWTPATWAGRRGLEAGRRCQVRWRSCRRSFRRRAPASGGRELAGDPPLLHPDVRPGGPARRR